MRDFNARCLPWPVVEQWANDWGYYLVAMKGNRRLYEKGQNPALYQTYLDIKEHDGHVTMAAWVQVGITLRLLSLFLLPREMKIDPTGIMGIVKRRAACREMNSLLERFRQVHIIGSGNLHWADLDITTLSLAASFLLPLALFLGFTGWGLELRPGLSNSLLIAMGEKASWLAGTATALLALQQCGVIRWLDRLLYRGLAAGASFTLFTVVAVVLLTRTAAEMAEARLTYHCVHRGDGRRCGEEIAKMSPTRRTDLLNRLKALEMELAARHK